MNTLQNNNFFSSENQNEIYSPNINLDNNSTNNININQNQTNIIPKKKNSFLNKQIQPSREIPYFFLNDYLSDAILKFDNNEIPFHKIIISSASDFFFDYFKTIKNPYEKIEVNLPEYIKSSLRADINNKEIVENIFKYCYNNQDIKIIEEKITKNNCFNYVEIAHCLKIKSLKEHLEKIIINNFLNEENEIKICEESNLFEMENVFQQCKENIIKNLGNIPNSKKEMTLLKYDIFRDIISSDELYVQNEKDICDLVIEYIKSRREIPEEKQDIKEIKEINNNELNKNIIQNNENLNEEEKKEENNPENQENNEEKKEENEIHEEKINEKNDIKENNENDPYNIWKKHIEELKQNSIKKRLSSEEEKNLVSCIRFSFLSHADLISLNNEPIMDNFKDLIMQGLSARLDTYENAKEKNIIINLKPRKYLKKKQEVNNPNINYNNTNTNNTNIDNKYFNTQKKEIEEENMNLNNQFNKFNDPRNYAYSQQINTNKFNNYINEDNSMNKNNMRNINNNENNREEINNFERYDENNNNNFIDNNESELNYLRAEVFNKDEIYAMNKKRNNELNSNKNISPSQSQVPYAPQDSKILKNYIDNKHQTISKKIFPVFKYTYDFDENGALYYIGTLGKKQIYCNPHELNLVTAFASSLSKGEISDFVGRNLVNLRTENEEFSFFGVDLGQNRKLIPTAYSIRNRNSSTHVLLCWELEGSNDKINFEILDRRIFRSDNYEMNKKLERERNLLIKPGCTSTWGISKKIREKFPEGFRYFILKQIDKNSNGSYNLTNSGFELYGDAKGNGWFFN
jgi:hypothetical protein